MKRLKVLISGIAVVGLLYPALSFAQPPGKTKSGEFARSVFAPVLSVVYFPIKLGTGIVGSALGGVSGFLTGGNERAAEGIWHPMTGGTYFITPAVLDGEEPFLPFDYGASAPQREAPPVQTPATNMPPTS